ncbi:MAG: hypothetical protein ACI87H_002149 [Gammaproteobacteria bacterium]|jgi:hypothetical protein
MLSVTDLITDYGDPQGESISPSIGELGLSVLIEHDTANPGIRLVAFKTEAETGLDLILWQSTSAVGRRSDEREIMSLRLISVYF